MTGPIWFGAKDSRIEASDGSETTALFAVVGAHQEVSDNLLVGGVLQFDSVEMSDAGGAEVSGTGWLVGPCFAAKLPDQDVYFEGSLLWGQTSNAISPFGTFEDSFEGERLVATFGMTGENERERFTVLPNANLRYVEDRQNA